MSDWLRRLIDSWKPTIAIWTENRTHYENCSEHHVYCALRTVSDAAEELDQEVVYLRDRVQQLEAALTAAEGMNV